MLEPEVLFHPERQVHVLYCRPRRSLEQVVYSRKEQELASPPICCRRDPCPVGVNDVRDVRRLGSRLDELPALVILSVPTENIRSAREILRPLELDDDRLELPAADRQKVRHEGYLGRLSHPPQHDLYLRSVPVPRRAARYPIRRSALVDAHEVGLDAGLGPGPADPRERVYSHGPDLRAEPPHHRREREDRRRRVTAGVGY